MSKHDHHKKHHAEDSPPPVAGGQAAGPVPRRAPTHEEIAVRAYEIWQGRGTPLGDGIEDWIEAERQLRDGSPAPLDPEPSRSGRPHQAHETVAEQAREARESEEARRAGPSNRERMVDIGRGNPQSGRHGG